MRSIRVLLRLLTVLTFALVSETASAQPLQKIAPFVVDVRGAIVNFGSDATLASTPGVTQKDLPGKRLGLDIGGHFYPFKLKKMTVGIGGHFITSRAKHETPPPTGSLAPPLEVRGRFSSFSPQFSLNFAGTTGYSYISGGTGFSTFTLTTEPDFPNEVERIKTIDYGGGGRWFNRRRVAFSFDIRFYMMKAQTSASGVLITPRMTRVVISAGASFR